MFDEFLEELVVKRQIKYSRMILVISMVICAALIGRKTLSNQSTEKEHRLQWWLKAIEWDKNREGLSGKGISIAILDTGVDFSHRDLEECKHKEKTIVDDSYGDKNHGTAIAGIIAAVPKDENGVWGIAPDTEIISYDITNEQTVKIDNLVKGITEAINDDVDIINISIGVKEQSKRLHESIKKAYDKGIVVIASAGNYMEGEILYPALYEEVIAVGAYDKSGKIISPKGNVNNVVFLPGSNVVSCIMNNGYSGTQGTSFSTAIMSGIVAIIKEKDKDITNKELYNKIYQSASLNGNKITVKNIIKTLKENN